MVGYPWSSKRRGHVLNSIDPSPFHLFFVSVFLFCHNNANQTTRPTTRCAAASTHFTSACALQLSWGQQITARHCFTIYPPFASNCHKTTRPFEDIMRLSFESVANYTLIGLDVVGADRENRYSRLFSFLNFLYA